MAVVCAATWGHVDDVCGPWGHVHVHALCCRWRPRWCLVSLTVGDATGDHKNFVDDHGPCCFWKPCRHPWSLLPLAVTGREASFAVSKEDCKLIIESERNWGLLGQPLFIPQEKGTLPIEASKESTYNMWQRYLGAVLHSWCLLEGRTQLSLRGQPLGVGSCSSGQNNFDLYFFLFWWEGTRVGSDGKPVWLGCLYEVPK